MGGEILQGAAERDLGESWLRNFSKTEWLSLCASLASVFGESFILRELAPPILSKLASFWQGSKWEDEYMKG